MSEAPDGYVLGKLVRAGASVSVFEATRESDGVQVVLKSYAADAAAAAGSRAARERDLIGRIASGGIARVLDLDLGTTPPTLVSEHPRGESLKQRMREGPLELRLWLDVATSLAETLAQIHAARVLHNDLRPTNIRVHAETGQATICDFSLAVELGAEERRAWHHDLHPNLLYIAPEQTGRMNRGSDVRSDLYSLGAVLYHALTGRPPFESTDRLELIHAHMARSPSLPCELRPAAPAALGQLVLKLLKKEPAERYQ